MSSYFCKQENAMALKSYARPLFLLGAILFGAGITFVILHYAIGEAKPEKRGLMVPIIPIKIPNPNGAPDSTFKTVGAFSFVDQTGSKVDRKSLNGKIWVADVFFTTCGSICPKLSAGLQRVQEAFKADPDVQLISFTVDPDYDSLPILRSYADEYGAIDTQWHFLTGNKTDLYRVETEEFFFSHTEDEDKTIKFVHDGKLRLVDKEGRFRGYFYDGTDASDIDSLIAHIKLLKREYAQIQ